MSSSGFPADSNQYLGRFLELDCIKSLKAQLEAVTGQPMTSVMELS